MQNFIICLYNFQINLIFLYFLISPENQKFPKKKIKNKDNKYSSFLVTTVIIRKKEIFLGYYSLN